MDEIFRVTLSGTGNNQTVTVASDLPLPMQLNGLTVDEPSYANIDRIKNKIGWQPKISIEDEVAAILKSLNKG